MTVTLATTPELKTVRDYSANDQVQGFYLLGKIETRNKKNGEPFLIVELADASGKIDGKMWNGFDDALETLRAGDAVFVDGRVDIYQNNAGLTLAVLRKATEKEVPDRSVFLPHSERSREEAKKELYEWIRTIENKHLKVLLEMIFEVEKEGETFLKVPGGKNWHHSTIGGLAEHTLSMVRLADMASKHYPQLNRDLLISGTILHDIGKVKELSFAPIIDYTSEGRLLGHITLGAMYIDRVIEREFPEFPSELRKQLLHLVLSHQGEPEKGSAVKPMTLEALVLHYLDDLDSRVSAFEQVRARTPESQEFSDYQRLMERFFYFRPADDDEGE